MHFFVAISLPFGYRHLAHVLTVPPTKATPAGLDLYIQLHACRYLPSAVPWISKDRLLQGDYSGLAPVGQLVKGWGGGGKGRRGEGGKGRRGEGGRREREEDELSLRGRVN